MNSFNLFNIFNVYMPPSSSIELYTTHLNTIDFIIQKYPNHSFILTGDYNLPFISWSNDTHGLFFLTQTISDFTSIPERLAIHGFFQHNYILNSHHSLLDLIFSNLSSITVNQALDTAAPADTYYPPLSLFINLPIHTPQSAPLKSFYNFNKADYTQINNFFNYFNCKRTFLSYSPNDSMSVFLDALHYSILSFVPKISFRPSTFPSWYTKEFKELVFANHPNYYQITIIFHFCALNLNSPPSNANVILSLVLSPPYYTTHNISGASLEKTALLYLYLQVLHYMVHRLTFLFHIFLLCSPSLHRLYPKHHILSASFHSRLMPIFQLVTSTNAYVPFFQGISIDFPNNRKDCYKIKI
ncbi:hypothetical protein QTP88_013042 [Uroleucon formosanum]